MAWLGSGQGPGAAHGGGDRLSGGLSYRRRSGLGPAPLFAIASQPDSTGRPNKAVPPCPSASQY